MSWGMCSGSLLSSLVAIPFEVGQVSTVYNYRYKKKKGGTVAIPFEVGQVSTLVWKFVEVFGFLVAIPFEVGQVSTRPAPSGDIRKFVDNGRNPF